MHVLQIYAGGHHVDPEARAGTEGTLLVKAVKVCRVGCQFCTA